MSLDTLIADTRQAIADDAANAHAVFTAQSTLVGVTEVDVSTGAHTFKVDEPPALGGADAAANPVQYALASLGSCQAITYRFWAAQLGVDLDSITGHGRRLDRRAMSAGRAALQSARCACGTTMCPQCYSQTQ